MSASETISTKTLMMDAFTPWAVWQKAWTEASRQAFEYSLDAAQRQILFWDVLRERGNVYLDHEINGQPPLLKFDFEVVMDGKDMERATNYSLLYIPPPPGYPQPEPSARPIVIVDPRAGHGPGIGGFKPDSQVGVSLRAGHPVYFVAFSPDPVPSQTIADVAWAEARFLETVFARHPQAIRKPAVIGNCQGGWATAGLAAVRPDLVGPLLLNGAPMSYWAGSLEQNPMRYQGGLMGGSWIASLTGDLGGGQFDGAHLVQNFESLNPANTYWTKYYKLYSNVDSEAGRFLDFERWWGGLFRMTTDEIESIVENLFVGNRLVSGTIHFAKESVAVDMRNISSPVVVFASFGDNITPPQQAVGWVADVWGDEQAIVAAGRTIVYVLHRNIGHLGIFVGAQVARKEHDQLINTLDQIEVLPPGLYEMVVDEHSDAEARDELAHGNWTVRFETRRISDLLALEADGTRDDEALFSTIAKASEWSATAYKTFARPLVRAVVPPGFGELTMAMNRRRLERSLISDANPLIKPLGALAERVRADRKPVSADNPFLKLEQSASQSIIHWLDGFRDARDAATARWVEAVYGPTGLGRWLPPDESMESKARVRAAEFLERARIDSEVLIHTGGFPEALVRGLFAAVAETGVLTRRSIRIAQMAGELANALIEQGRVPGVQGPVDWKRIREEQARVLALHPERALEALPGMLSDPALRNLATGLIGKILMSERGDGDVRSELMAQVETSMGVSYQTARLSLPAAILEDEDDALPSLHVSINLYPDPDAPAPARDHHTLTGSVDSTEHRGGNAQVN